MLIDKSRVTSYIRRKQALARREFQNSSLASKKKSTVFSTDLNTVAAEDRCPWEQACFLVQSCR
jgi:lipoate synthase